MTLHVMARKGTAYLLGAETRGAPMAVVRVTYHAHPRLAKVVGERHATDFPLPRQGRGALEGP